MPDMTSILSRPVNSVERPPELLAGDYLFQVVAFDTSKKSSNGNEQIIWTFNALQPIEVDGDLSKYEFPYKFTSFMVLTEKSAVIAREFLENTLAIDPAALNLTFGEALPLTIGKLFKGTIIQDTYTKPGTAGDGKVRSKLDKTAPAE